MVRVSWGIDSILPENEVSNRRPRLSSLPFSPTPTSSNTSTNVTSPSSPSRTISPAPTVSPPSNEFCNRYPEVEKRASPSLISLENLRNNLLHELQQTFSSFRRSPKKHFQLIPLEDKQVNVDANTTQESIFDETDDCYAPIMNITRDSSKDPLIQDDSVDVVSLKKTVTHNTIVNPLDEDIFKRMFATLSECDDFEPIDSVSVCSASDLEEFENEKELLVDKWRELFDKYDMEGFGEILWEDFHKVLMLPEFIANVDPCKREQLIVTAKTSKSNVLTFQEFVNIMSGKRTRSFKCAVHERDREVSSENDFHVLINEPPLFKKMVRIIADEFLTEERDRKYYADHYKCWPPPIFIIFVTLLQLAVFCYYTLVTGEMEFGGPVPMDGPFIYRPDKRHHVWRFILYALLHAGWVHLAFNLLVQLLVGLPLEMIHGSARIGTVYFAGVLAGSLGTSVFDSKVFLVGASGGVYALLAAHLANVLLNYNSMQYGVIRLVAVIFVASADVGYAIYDRYAHFSMGLPVSYVAHLTGALAGLTLGLVVLKNFEQKLHEQLIWWVALGVFLACTIFAVIFNVFHPYPYLGVYQRM